MLLCFQSFVGYVCQVCHAPFKRKPDLNFHLRGFHGLGKPLSCEFCGKLFQSNSTRHRHKKVCKESKKNENVGQSDSDNNMFEESELH